MSKCIICDRELGIKEPYWAVLQVQKVIICKFCAPTINEVNEYVCNTKEI